MGSASLTAVHSCLFPGVVCSVLCVLPACAGEVELWWAWQCLPHPDYLHVHVMAEELLPRLQAP